MKKGDKAVMCLLTIGVKTLHDRIIREIDEDSVTLEAAGDDAHHYRFSLKTGECLNDMNDYDETRTLIQ